VTFTGTVRWLEGEHFETYHSGYEWFLMMALEPTPVEHLNCTYYLALSPSNMRFYLIFATNVLLVGLSVKRGE